MHQGPHRQQHTFGIGMEQDPFIGYVKHRGVLFHCIQGWPKGVNFVCLYRRFVLYWWSYFKVRENFMNKQEQREARKQEKLRRQAEAKTPEGRYKGARGALLFIVVINVIVLVWMAASAAAAGMDFPVVDIALNGGLVVLLALSWALSKKQHAWMTIALVLFSIDTVLWIINFVLAIAQNPAMIGTIVLRVMLWYTIFMGAKAVKELKNKAAQDEGAAGQPDSGQ